LGVGENGIRGCIVDCFIETGLLGRHDAVVVYVLLTMKEPAAHRVLICLLRKQAED
jgi:hypothetical protein